MQHKTRLFLPSYWMTREGLHVTCLLQLARQVAGLRADSTWISARHLICTAMSMGLHRDHIPAYQIARFTTANSIGGVGPTSLRVFHIQHRCRWSALLSVSDSDTELPDNLDDADLMGWLLSCVVSPQSCCHPCSRPCLWQTARQSTRSFPRVAVLGHHSLARLTLKAWS